MTVETGSDIAGLNANAPADSEPLGESNEHIQRTKLAQVYTWEGSPGDRYDEVSGPVKVGPIALNRMPNDILTIAAEIGLDLDNPSDPTTIDDLVTNALRRDQAETITQAWSFTGTVDFAGATSFTGIVPTIDGVDVATVDDVPTYLERSRLQVRSVSSAPSTLPYDVVPTDLGKKIVYTGADNDPEISIGTEGIDTDLLFITNANTNANPGGVTLNVTSSSLFQLPDGSTAASIGITGRYRTIGLHKVNGAWQVTGDVDP